MPSPDIHSFTTVFQEPSSTEIPPSEIVHSTESLMDDPSAGPDSSPIAAALRKADLVTDEVEALRKGSELAEFRAEAIDDTPERAAYKAEIAAEYVAFNGMLINFMMRKTGTSLHDAEDAAQEAFLAALKLEQATPPTRSFYFVVGFRTVMAQWRKGNRMQLLGEDIPRLPEEVTYNIETMEWVEFALLRVSAPERELAGRLLLGQPRKGIAESLNIPEREVRSRIEALHKKLTQMARDEEWR